MRIRSKLLTKLTAWLTVVSMRTIFVTLRKSFEMQDPDTLAYDPDGRERYLYCTWHDSIMFPLFMGRHCHSAGIVSRHQDGSYLAEAMKLINVKPVRGSSGKGGAQALRESIAVTRDHHITVTPDGPRGPEHVMKDGIVFLAAKSGRRIAPLTFQCSSCWRLRGSWTDLIVPRPFSRVKLIVGKPIEIPKKLSREQLDEYTAVVQSAMDELYAAAGSGSTRSVVSQAATDAASIDSAPNADESDKNSDNGPTAAAA